MAKERIYSRAVSLGSAVSVGNLVQDITDEFLVCKICLDNYRNPKCLACLHTFCEACIENHIQSEATYKKYSDYRDFTCPLCRKRTQLPVGGVKKLPDNFLISSLSEMVGKQKSSGENAPLCEICSAEKEATGKCLECNKMLCQACVELHRGTKVTRGHSLIDIDIEDEVLCKMHKDEVVRFFCSPCQTCICVLCTFNEHREHDVSNFTDVVGNYKEDIQRLLADCHTRIGEYEENIERMTATSDIIDEAETGVHDLALSFISEVRQREKLLIEEIQNIYGKPTLDLIQRRVDFEMQLEALRSGAKLTEVALARKDIELLLVKREVVDNLNQLLTTTSTDIRMPENCSKVVRFLPGHVEMGCIQDMDRPLATTRSACMRQFGQDAKDYKPPTLESSSCQTSAEASCELAIQTQSPELVDRAVSPVAELLFQSPSTGQEAGATASFTLSQSFINNTAEQQSHVVDTYSSNQNYSTYNDQQQQQPQQDTSNFASMNQNIESVSTRMRSRRRLHDRAYTVDSSSTASVGDYETTQTTEQIPAAPVVQSSHYTQPAASVEPNNSSVYSSNDSSAAVDESPYSARYSNYRRRRTNYDSTGDSYGYY